MIMAIYRLLVTDELNIGQGHLIAKSELVREIRSCSGIFSFILRDKCGQVRDKLNWQPRLRQINFNFCLKRLGDVFGFRISCISLKKVFCY